MSVIPYAYRSGVSALAIGMCAIACPARAADQLDYASIPIIVSQSCDNIAPSGPPVATDVEFDGGNWRIVPSARVAYFISSFAGEITAPDLAVELLSSFDNDSSARTKHSKAADALHQFEAKLASRNLDGMLAFDASGKPVSLSDFNPESSWLMRPNITLRCLVPEARSVSIAGASGAGGPSIRLRGTVDALAAEGVARKSADAASFGYSRTRTFEADGSRSQATEISVDAVLGAVLSRGPGLQLTAFAGYELKQNRTKPAPSLAPPAAERDGDTDIVTIGLAGDSILSLGGTENPWTDSLRLTYSGAYLFDRVKHSERVKGQITANYYHGNRIFGICKIGGLTDLGGGIWTSCQVIGTATYNQVTKRGSLIPSGTDHFGHAGVKLSGSLYLGDPSEGSSFFANADYQHLWRYDGDPAFIPDITRHSFSLGHRWWQASKFAFEVKAELTDGINPDSFANENSLTLGFGIIF